MSEKLFAWMLRMYPARFREDYGGEMLQLLRDRERDESGFRSRLRLWFDLVADLALSLPREYRHAREAIPVAARVQSDGTPSFCLLESSSPRTGSMLLGAVLSLIALAAFP